MAQDMFFLISAYFFELKPNIPSNTDGTTPNIIVPYMRLEFTKLEKSYSFDNSCFVNLITAAFPLWKNSTFVPLFLKNIGLSSTIRQFFLYFLNLNHKPLCSAFLTELVA